jgi:hypothetical protein
MSISLEPPASESLVWQTVGSSAGPKARALHIGAVVDDAFFLHGGYDGMNRCGDFWRFDFSELKWTQVATVDGVHPSARDRHACAVTDKKMYLFGGYDGSNRVNDFWEYDAQLNKWTDITNTTGGTPPSPRHSHSMFFFDNKIHVLFGYDGNYRNDLYIFDCTSRLWSATPTRGTHTPKARYRNSATVVKDKLFVFGGHDGARHLGDAFVLSLITYEWSEITPSAGVSHIPQARDSHSACLHTNGQVIVFGGSSGVARSDILAFDLEKRVWQEWKYTENTHAPVPRFCHVAVIHRNSLYVNSGYDGTTRLSDFKRLPLPDNLAIQVPEPTIIQDLRGFVNNSAFADVAFVLDDGSEVKAHKILLHRCPYFACMFAAQMQEANEGRIRLKDVSQRALMKLLEIIYTDEALIEEEDMSFVLELLVIADRHGVERLKALCEIHIVKNINFENAAGIVEIADQHSALILRAKAMDFILKHFDSVSKSKAFEDMAKHNVDLLLEIIKKR